MDITLSDRMRVQKFGKIQFRCRLQKNINTYYSKHSLRFSRSCRRALACFVKAILSGQIQIQQRSNFFSRTDKNDKVSRAVLLTKDLKDWMEKFSFSEKISQNEVLRMALEWWMETAAVPEGRRYRAACEKWYHDRVQTRPEEFFFSFWRYGRERYEKFPTLEEVQNATMIPMHPATVP